MKEIEGKLIYCAFMPCPPCLGKIVFDPSSSYSRRQGDQVTAI
jgi:hypothetical protein